MKLNTKVPELTDEIANELDSDANSVDEYKKTYANVYQNKSTRC